MIKNSKCFRCREPFDSRHNHTMCDTCAESYIERRDRRPNCTYKEYVYALYNQKEMIYIGVTNNPINRVKSHILKKKFTKMYLVKGFSSRAKALEFETYAIDHYRPVLNIAITSPRREIVGIWTREVETISKIEMEVGQGLYG